jgi:cytochrome c
MASFEFNKIAGAVLGTALMVFGLKSLAGVVYQTESPAKQGFVIEVAENNAGGGNTGAADQPTVSLGTLLAAADAEKGKSVAKACGTCHDFTKGGPNKVGPNLYGVVGRKHASHEGYDYSDAMKAKSGDVWTYEALFAFLKAPKEVIPGTKMGFAGIKKDTDRANLLAYLRTLSDAPVDFPAP